MIALLCICRKYLAAMILITVALVQIVRAKYLDQSPWKGGGFGMFSTIDSTSARSLQIALEIDGSIHSGNAALNSVSQASLMALLFTPSTQKLKKLREEVSALIWFDLMWEERLKINGRNPLAKLSPRPLRVVGAATDSGPGLPSAQTILRPTSIDIKMFKYNFKAEGLILTNQLLFESKWVPHESPL